MATATARKADADVLLREYTSAAGTGCRILREASTVSGLKILGTSSANGRDYPLKTLRESVRLYEGVPVYFDHLECGQQRRYGDRFGNMTNVRATNDGLYGDLVYNPKHPLAEQVLHDIEAGTKDVGCSPDHYGRGPTQNGRRIVEAITSVKSVDIVANPATNKSFSESTRQGTDAMELAEQLAEQVGKVGSLTSENAGLKEQIAKLAEQVSTLTGEKAKLQESVDAAAKAQAVADHKTAVTKLLDDNKIPDHLRKPELIALYESVDAKAAEAAIKALAEAGKSATSFRSVAGTPFRESASDTKPSDGKSFAASLR